MITSSEIRSSFLDFFKSKGHTIVKSAPVIPYGDPTLLFTNAGMNQFKDVFLGTGKREYTRAADTQKCIRVSGKHNDLEEVGFDTYHHTFFEMLGNWSFGDYYKQEAIQWAWELLTEVWGLPKERLHATVYQTDDEAYEIWKEFLPVERIHRFDEKDNFWEMGETGPCGPCSEIHYDRTEDLSGGKLVNAGDPRVIEIWNLVFIQYNRRADGSLEELSAKHIDTGMGFERICAVIQNKNSNYDTDVFSPIIKEIEKISKRRYYDAVNDKDCIAMRVIADHLRTLAFAIADGAFPGNEGRGYVLRRILRRASRFARNLDLRPPVIYTLLPALISNMGDVFPELINHQDTIQKVIKAEEELFSATLDRGLEKFEEIKLKLEQSHQRQISGDDAFQLYDTFGFPLDLTELLARENGFTVDLDGFDKKMEEQKHRSREARKSLAQEIEYKDMDFKTEFTGYDEFMTKAKVLYVSANQIVTDRTPFYAESGGQVSDTGIIRINDKEYRVIDVKKVGEAIIHICDAEITEDVGVEAVLEVDVDRRKRIMRNHSATHLLHEALRQVLGNHIQQAGSLVAPNYLRFDFNHFEKVSAEDLNKIEAIVNAKIFEGVPVEKENMRLEEAQKEGNIKMFFGDKYGADVRVISMDKNFSRELCGGTHVSNTAEIGYFKIVSESSIAAGIRRIEAITGPELGNYINSLHEKLQEKQHYIETLQEEIKSLQKEVAKLNLQSSKQEIANWVKNAINVNGVQVVAKQYDKVENIDQLRTIGEELRNALKHSGIGLVATILDDKVQMVVVVTDDLTKSYPAGKLVAQSAKLVGGGGGGKAHLATAGGKDVSKIDVLINEFPKLISNFNNG